MPWEIDNALLTFIQLKKSYYYLSKDVNVIIETVLNLSSKLINWNNSKLSKEFFVDKYNNISKLLCNYTHIKRIYDGDEVYGYLNLQKESISHEIDYYIGVCPDICFTEQLLYFLTESTKQIKNEYFIVTPQIYKRWDSTWDEITNPHFMSVPYTECNNYDLFEIQNQINNHDDEVALVKVQNHKWAWWFDVYNKKFYEDLCPVHQTWNGYGPWDMYSMLLSTFAKNNGVDVCQYLLKGQTILETLSDTLRNAEFTSYYKNMLDILPEHSPKNQRQKFESQIHNYLNTGVEMIKNKNISMFR